MYRAKILNKKSIPQGNTINRKVQMVKRQKVEKLIPKERYVLNIDRTNSVEKFNEQIHAITKYQTTVIILDNVKSAKLMLHTYIWSKNTLQTIANVRKLVQRKYFEWNKWQCKAVCQLFKGIWPEYNLVQIRQRMPLFPYSKLQFPDGKKYLYQRDHENFEETKRLLETDGRAQTKDWHNKEKDGYLTAPRHLKYDYKYWRKIGKNSHPW